MAKAKSKGRAKSMRGHNSGVENEHDDDDFPTETPEDVQKRLAAIDKAHNAFYKLEKQENDLLEKYIKPIREKKAEIKGDLKKDYGVATNVFNARQGVFRIEKNAEETNDDIELDALREQWEATPIGKNLDLVALAERASKARAERDKAAAESKTKGKSTEAEA